MTTYYVRKTGSDAASGLSPALAWLTVDHAVGNIGDGDTIYVGAGIYRELVSSWRGGNTTETSLIGDTDGSHTGDAGEVVITAFLTNDTTAASANTTLNEGLGGTDFWTLQYLTIVGGTSTTNSCFYMNNDVHWIIRDCTFWGGMNVTRVVMFGDNYDATAAHNLFERNRVFAYSRAIEVGTFSTNPSPADVDLDVIFRNNLIIALNGACITLEQGQASNTKAGGLVIKNNLLITGAVAVGGTNVACVQTNTNNSTANPCLVYNNHLVSGGRVLIAQTSGQIVSDYNLTKRANTNTNVTAGTHDQTAYDNRFLFGQEQSYGAVLRPFGMPVLGSPIFGFGAFDTSVTDDLLQGIRPGSGNASVLRSVGPFERANSAKKNVSVLYSTIPQSVEFDGPAYQDWQLPVPHGNVTVTIQARFDSTYAGTLPQMKVRNGGECGVADDSVTTTGSADTWTQISLSFTTTAVGIVTIRLQSNDTNGGGKAYFAYAVVT